MHNKKNPQTKINFKIAQSRNNKNKIKTPCDQ